MRDPDRLDALQEGRGYLVAAQDSFMHAMEVLPADTWRGKHRRDAVFPLITDWIAWIDYRIRTEMQKPRE